MNAELIQLKDAPEVVEEMVGIHPSYHTLYRWGTRGVRGIFLNMKTIAGRHYVTRRDLEDFLEATSAPVRVAVA